MCEVDCSFDTNAIADAENVSLLWHYHSEPVFLFLVCATDLCFKNYNDCNLYHGEVLQYAILKFLQYPQVFSFIDINVLIHCSKLMFGLLQQSNKTFIIILKDDSNFYIFQSFIPNVTCWYFEFAFLKITKTKK